MKDYKIYLRDDVIHIDLARNRTTNIDLVTRSRLTEGKLAVSSIPFREAIGAYDVIIIDSRIDELLKHGFFNAGGGMVLHSEIDQILRNVMERGESALVIDSRAELISCKVLGALPNALQIQSAPVALQANTFERADDTVVLAVDKMDIEMTKQLLGVEPRLELRASARELKTAFEQVNAPIPISAEIAKLNSYKCGSFSNSLQIQSYLQSLCYQLFCGGGATTMVPHVEPLDTEIHYSLGGGATSLVIDSTPVETAKNSFLQPATSVVLAALPVEFLVTYTVGLDAKTAIAATVSNLCYNRLISGSAAMEITASLGELEEHFSLGNFDAGLQIDSRAAKHFLLEKKNQVDSDSILTAACEAALNGASPEIASVITLGCTLQELLLRHRLLEDMDSDALAAFDEITLEDLRYVVI